jgi:hypothetical protein
MIVAFGARIGACRAFRRLRSITQTERPKVPTPRRRDTGVVEPMSGPDL